MKLTDQLHDYVSAAFSGIWISTQEPDEAQREILQHARQQQWKVAVWDVANGLRLPGNPGGPRSDAGSGDPESGGFGCVRSSGDAGGCRCAPSQGLQLARGSSERLGRRRRLPGCESARRLLECVGERSVAGRCASCGRQCLSQLVQLRRGELRQRTGNGPQRRRCAREVALGERCCNLAKRCRPCHGRTRGRRRAESRWKSRVGEALDLLAQLGDRRERLIRVLRLPQLRERVAKRLIQLM